jgi:hypothetical protein
MGHVISRLWTFVFFTMLSRDIHEMSTADTIEGILAGTYEGNVVTDAGLFYGGLALVLMLLTSLFSTLLVPSAVRRLNLIVAPLAIAGGFYLFPNDPDDYLLAGAATTALLAIFFVCWFWRPALSSNSHQEARHAV